jgi:two-component system, LuxR family, sensor kinase FixL
MPPERCLEPFRTTKADGLGMGLAICKSILDAHGGQIRFDTVAGEGTYVTILIPTV